MQLFTILFPQQVEGWPTIYKKNKKIRESEWKIVNIME